jgi:arylsulfatase A-like enzyme
LNDTNDQEIDMMDKTDRREPENAGRPNIVFIFSDEQSGWAWSGSGDPAPPYTPNLERLAAQGLVFDNCISNNPICVPARASLITGRFGHQNGIRWNDLSAPLSTDNPSWTVELKRLGYKMGYVGKWHLYPRAGSSRMEEGRRVLPDIVPPGPDRFGFDDAWIKAHDYIKRGFIRYYDNEGHEVELPGYAPTYQMDQALGFIEEHKDEPFCVMLSWQPPHPPYNGAPPEWEAYYQDRRVELRPNVPGEYANEQLVAHYRGHFAHISALDTEMGRLLDRLEALGIADNTIVVYTSDHGDLLRSHGELWKRWPWDESIKVPFIIRWPGHIPQGQRSDLLLGTPDIGPTLLGLLGEPTPLEMQGLGMSEGVLGRSYEGPESALIMYIRPPGGNYMTQKMPQLVDYRGVRTKRYTYTRRRDDAQVTPWQLYDNAEDPYQLRNLIDDPAHADTKQWLAEELDRWLSFVGERFE